MRFLKVLLFVFLWTGVASALPIKKLWVAVRGNACAQCKQKIDDYLDCMFNETNFRSSFLDSYPTGIDLVIGGTKTIASDCGQYDFQCVVNEAGFPVADDDVLMYVWGADYCSGGENQRGRTVVINGKTIHPRTGWIDAQGCDCITPILLHEIYEAANDQDSADCCNGQNGGNGYGYNYNATCNQKFGANGSVAAWGWYYFQGCSKGQFRTQYLAQYPKKGDSNACTKLALGCPMGGTGKVLHAQCTQASECCSGYACENWVLNGSDPLKTVCCSAIGSSCSQPTDCCGGSDCDANTHKCVCVPKDGWCINPDECCGGQVCDMIAHKCVDAPPDAGPPDAGPSNDGGGTYDGGPMPEAGDGEYDVPLPGGCQCNAAVMTTTSSPDASFIVLALGLLVRRRRR
jgi:hypothetical protein